LRFPIQEWRKSTLPSIKRNAWYVSSVDPTLLELLWQGDAYSGKELVVFSNLSSQSNDTSKKYNLFMMSSLVDNLCIINHIVPLTTRGEM